MKIAEDLVLYHYTSASTLYEIIRNQSLRATSLAYLNDKQEVVHGQKILAEWCRRTLLPDHLAYAKQALMDMEEVVKAYDIRNLFGVCFSEHSDMLSQWRGYANQGHGYAIGFRAVRLQDKCIHLAYGNLTHILYDVQEFLAMLDRLLPFFPEEYSERAMRDKVDALISGLKDAGFAEEKEWRIVVARDVNDIPQVPDQYVPFCKRIGFFERNSVLVPYVDLGTFPGVRLPIEKIVIGPSIANKENAKYSLELLLQQAGYSSGEVEIVNSKIPFLP